MSDGGMKSPAGLSADSVSRGHSGVNAPSHANPRGIWRCPLSALLPLSHKQEIQRSYAFHLRVRLIPVSASRCSRLFKMLLTFPPPRLHIPRLALNKTPTHISLAASLFTRAGTRLQTRRGALQRPVGATLGDAPASSEMC